MAKQNKQRRKRVENRYIVLTATKGKEDVKGRKALQDARNDLEGDGFRISGTKLLANANTSVGASPAT